MGVQISKDSSAKRKLQSTSLPWRIHNFYLRPKGRVPRTLQLSSWTILSSFQIRRALMPATNIEFESGRYPHSCDECANRLISVRLYGPFEFWRSHLDAVLCPTLRYRVLRRFQKNAGLRYRRTHTEIGPP